MLIIKLYLLATTSFFLAMESQKNSDKIEQFKLLITHLKHQDIITYKIQDKDCLKVTENASIFKAILLKNFDHCLKKTDHWQNELYHDLKILFMIETDSKTISEFFSHLKQVLIINIKQYIYKFKKDDFHLMEQNYCYDLPSLHMIYLNKLFYYKADKNKQQPLLLDDKFSEECHFGTQKEIMEKRLSFKEKLINFQEHKPLSLSSQEFEEIDSLSDEEKKRPLKQKEELSIESEEIDSLSDEEKKIPLQQKETFRTIQNTDLLKKPRSLSWNDDMSLKEKYIKILLKEYLDLEKKYNLLTIHIGPFKNHYKSNSFTLQEDVLAQKNMSFHNKQIDILLQQYIDLNTEDVLFNTEYMIRSIIISYYILKRDIDSFIDEIPDNLLECSEVKMFIDCLRTIISHLQTSPSPFIQNIKQCFDQYTLQKS